MESVDKLENNVTHNYRNTRLLVKYILIKELLIACQVISEVLLLVPLEDH